ncbi:hypothetical protein C7N43_24430 [Sphingobacteriales bacterium UPWRP_1]|nr:hypothetical protein BVG80_16770 [Sphingobacteriales bacterium TSM_CSM]PSJ74354.1 hypothetical protein C7N43_24430 [Sphingobacteriales bacterium UPWRP_1]
MKTFKITSHDRVRAWIKEGEGTTLEFKEKITEPYKVAKTICAFANTKGGILLSGITDDGKIVGVVEPELEKERLAEAAIRYCYPPIEPVFWEYEEDFLVVLALHIEESSVKPHKAMLKNGQEQVYIRTGNKTMPAGKLTEKVLRNEPPKNETPENNTELTSKEQGLLEYLKKHERITLKQFARLVNISERRARRMLVQLTLDGYIRLHDGNKENFYTL